MDKLRISPEVSMPIDTVTSTIGLLGVRGSGKTHCSSVLVEEMLQNNLHTVILDPLDVWWGLKSSADGKKEGYPILIMGGKHGDVPLEPTAGKVVAKLVIDEKLPVILSMKHFSDSEACRFVAAFLLEIFRLCRDPMHIIVDEADMFAPQRPMRGSNKELSLHAMDSVVRRGRASGLGVSLLTQRPAVIHKDVLTQCETLIVLRILGPQDRSAVEAWIKFHGNQEERDEVLKSLHKLPTGTGWVWSPNLLGILVKTKFRERKTFDSSATPKVRNRRARIEPKKLAKVDLGRIKGMIADSIERAKQEDPQELRKEIMLLKKALSAKAPDIGKLMQEMSREQRVKWAKFLFLTDPIFSLLLSKEIDKALDQAEKHAKVQKVPAIDRKTIIRMQKSTAKLVAVSKKLRTSATEIVRETNYALRQSGLQVETMNKVVEMTAAKQPEVPNTLPDTKRRYPLVPQPGPPPPNREPGSSPVFQTGSGPDLVTLKPGETRMLQVLAKRHPISMAKGAWARVSGYTKTGGTFVGNVARIRKWKLIKEAAGEVFITDWGFQAIGETPSLVPQTPEEILEMWQSKLSPGEWKILQFLLEVNKQTSNPTPRTKEEIAAGTSYTASGGTFVGILATLKKIGLIVLGGGGYLIGEELKE